MTLKFKHLFLLGTVLGLFILISCTKEKLPASENTTENPTPTDSTDHPKDSTTENPPQETVEYEPVPENLKGYFDIFWQDEFEGEELDLNKWNYRAEGDKRNYATVSRNTISLDGKGHLIIKVTKDKSGNYQVGQTGTEGIFSTKYGYFECRAKMNNAEGPHVAFWLQSPTMGKTDNNPTKNGTEIDIFEYHRKTPQFVHHNLHWNGYGTEHHQEGTQIQIPEIYSGFHTFGLLWTENRYTFYVDGQKTWSTTKAVSQTKEYLILSTELTGFGGDPSSGSYPDSIIFDYVRVYKPNENWVENQENDSENNNENNESSTLYADFDNIDSGIKQGYQDMNFVIVDNPDKSNLNTSEKSGRITTTAHKWDYVISKKFDNGFDFSQDTTFTMKVFTTVPGMLYFKVESRNSQGDVNTDAQVRKEVTEANKWVEVSFPFKRGNGADEIDLNEDYVDFVITFDAGNEEAGNDWYFDDVSGPILKK